ncbi:MAG TPA: DUF1707 domain-containing protein [Streptosporangiaceae bacterium]|nr:DUF1707 domain-containing protein [Streptosporangiaceae bacterium]
MGGPGFNQNSGLRASDADRDAAAGVINNALAEGRLTADEHNDRLDAIYAAKMQADLAPLLADLPGQHALAPVTATSGQLARSRRGGRIVAIFGGATRKGAWHPEPVIDVLTVFGGAELDFRDAVLPGNEITLRATSVLGGVEVTVPPEMRVIDNGSAILGGREIRGGPESGGPDSPVLRIEGICVLGGIEVRRKQRRGERPASRALGRRSDLVLEDVRGQAIERRRDLHDEIRERRRAWRDEMRAQRRDLRRGSAEPDDE